MPPMRTPLPASNKLNIPIKTERSHEENQERAYIAASRRSDRSLEARVESARRASEIHKKRTGRSLRVTEQDVINEEMYEEEDDDLPIQYRRMTAHLQTNSSDFNRRLSAYLTSHQAMRNALSQALNNSYAQSAMDMSQMPHQQQEMPQFSQNPQPFNLTLPPRKSSATSPTFSADNQPTSPTTASRNSASGYRQAPYTTNNFHQRSASFNVGSPATQQRESFSSHKDSTQLSKAVEVDELKQTSGNTVFPQPRGNPIWDQNNDLGPFSANLPNDARMFLDNEAISQQYMGLASFEKPHMNFGSNGMDQTLAPVALDKGLWDEPSSAVTQDDALSPDAYRSQLDGGMSPSEDMWNFIDDSAYETTT